MGPNSPYCEDYEVFNEPLKTTGGSSFPPSPAKTYYSLSAAAFASGSTDSTQGQLHNGLWMRSHSSQLISGPNPLTVRWRTSLSVEEWWTAGVLKYMWWLQIVWGKVVMFVWDCHFFMSVLSCQCFFFIIQNKCCLVIHLKLNTTSMSGLT